jgi:hypothetical protein
MPEPATVHFNREGDEISDSKSFSLMSVIGFVCSAVGISSIGYSQTLPFAVVGVLIGAVTLIIANRFQLSFLSQVFAFLAVIMGATCASWGFSERLLETSSDMAHAKNIAERYVESLSAQELDKVYYLVGFQFSGDSSEKLGSVPTSDMQRAKDRLDRDLAHLEIRNRKTQPKWVFVSLDGEFPGTLGHTYRLRYRDEAQTIPSEYWLYVRKNCEKYSTQQKVHWFVDNLEFVKK